MRINYEGRLFGDVLHELVYGGSGDVYEFCLKTQVNNVSISNYISHKRYPSPRTLVKISKVLPEEDRDGFIEYFSQKEVRKAGEELLKSKGMTYPYLYSTMYKPGFPYTEKFGETSAGRLARLQVTGLFKYLTEEEKKFFKSGLVNYIVNRNQAIQRVECTKSDS